MALNDIYVLPSGFPLFDWSVWPDSEAALIPGGFTHEFEKECWNAIVNLLSVALSEAGESWDSKYTTPTKAKIFEEYGALYADAINSVFHNIDNAVPVLRWNWAHDRNFRGYIGRKEFHGVAGYGEKGADSVYPEYILELVDRLNFLIRIMTGEAATVAQGRGLSLSVDSVLARSVPSLPIDGIRGISLSKSLVSVGSFPSIAAQIRGLSASKSIVKLRSWQAIQPQPKHSKSMSFSQAAVHSKESISAKPKPSLSKSLNHVRIFAGQPVFWKLSKELSKTISRLTVRTAETSHIKPQAMSTSKGVLNLTDGTSAPVVGYDISRSSSRCAIDQIHSTSVEMREISKSHGFAVLGTAWYPPIWDNGGLLFTQVQQNATWLEDGFYLLEVCETAAWIADGLYIMQIDNANLKNGVLEVA